MVGAAAHYVHGAQAAGGVAEDLREAIKEMVAFNVLPATLWALRWSDAGFPTIINTEILRAEAAFWTQGESKMEHLLSARTKIGRNLEKARIMDEFDDRRRGEVDV